MKVTRSFTFGGVEYQVGDELDVDALEPDDRADLVSRGVFSKEESIEKEPSKSKVEDKGYKK